MAAAYRAIDRSRGLPLGVPLDNRTGELPGARHDAGIVDPYGSRPYVLVVLEKDLDDRRSRGEGFLMKHLPQRVVIPVGSREYDA